METRWSARIVTLALLVFTSSLFSTSCRDASSDRELADGKLFRNKLREHECHLDTINDKEFEYSQRLMLRLAAMKNAETRHVTNEHLTAEDVQLVVHEIDAFILARTEIKEDLVSVCLKTPLPLAFKYDVAEVLDEHIRLNRKWMVRLERLIDAFRTGEEVLINDQVRQAYELFQSYGMPPNYLKVAADELEEGLRIPWYASPNHCKSDDTAIGVAGVKKSVNPASAKNCEESE